MKKWFLQYSVCMCIYVCVCVCVWEGGLVFQSLPITVQCSMIINVLAPKIGALQIEPQSKMVAFLKMAPMIFIILQ
jgi:hypothetical protein